MAGVHAERAAGEGLTTTQAPFIEQAQAEGRLAPDADAAALVELVELVFEALQARAAAGTFVTSHERVAAAFLSVLSAQQIQGVLA